jgi:chorismate mutase
MMKPKRQKAPDEDEAQSRRFMEEAEKTAADGGLSPTEVEGFFEGAMSKIVPKKQRPRLR